MAVSKKVSRYPVTFYIDEDGEVEGEANAYPVLTRPGEGALPSQEPPTQVKFRPSDALKAPIKAEQKFVVDAQLAR